MSSLLIQKIISNLFLSPSFFYNNYYYIYVPSKKRKEIIFFSYWIVYLFHRACKRSLWWLPWKACIALLKLKILRIVIPIFYWEEELMKMLPTSLRENGIPSELALTRIVEAARLYKVSPKKIIISGGAYRKSLRSESSIYKTMLIDLGIPKYDIILETESLTTPVIILNL